MNEGQPLSFVAFAVDPHNPTFVLPTREPDGTLSPYPTTRPTVTYTVSGLPPGATFDPDTALFSWTPANHQNGTYNVVFTATNDGYGGPLSSSVTVPITVLIVNHAPVVTPIADITVAAGGSFDQAVQAIDPDGNPVTLSVENGIPGYAFPSWVTLTDNSGGNGMLDFNPPAGNRGTYAITLLATDNGDGLGPASVLTGTYTFIVTVQSAIQPPVLGYIGNQVAHRRSAVHAQPAGERARPGQPDLHGCRIARRRGTDTRIDVWNRHAQLDAKQRPMRVRTTSPLSWPIRATARSRSLRRLPPRSVSSRGLLTPLRSLRALPKVPRWPKGKR